MILLQKSFEVYDLLLLLAVLLVQTTEIVVHIRYTTCELEQCLENETKAIKVIYDLEGILEQIARSLDLHDPRGMTD